MLDALLRTLHFPSYVNVMKWIASFQEATVRAGPESTVTFKDGIPVEGAAELAAPGKPDVARQALVHCCGLWHLTIILSAREKPCLVKVGD